MVVERREAQRARSRRFAQADRSVARATPEAWAGGNIRRRGVAHDPAPPGAPLGIRVAFRDRGFGKTRTQRKRAARTEERVRHCVKARLFGIVGRRPVGTELYSRKGYDIGERIMGRTPDH
jgi:hypothetical protein